MKRIHASLLSLLLLFSVAAFAQAETATEIPAVTLDFDSLQYEGGWWNFDGMNFKLYFPTGWVENTEDYVGDADYEFAMNAGDASAYFNIRVYLDDSGAAYENRFMGMLADIGTNEAAVDVTPVSLNGVNMITYTVAEDVGMGTIILTDDAYLIVETAPATEENAALFIQILSTFTLEEA